MESGKMKLQSELIIETTRNCNLTCSHCLRGDRESKNISFEHMENTIKQFSEIHTITFTGGEPALNTKAIHKFMELCNKHNVTVNNFYIATNGTIASDKFLKALMDLYIFCDENESSQLSISNDEYHDYDQDVIDKLMVFRFASLKYSETMRSSNLIDEGNANYNGLGGRINTPESFEYIDKEYFESDGQLQDYQLYLNCNGDIVGGCDWSFNNQEDHILCKSNESIFDAIQVNINSLELVS